MTAFSKGAPEVILGSCTKISTPEGEAPLDAPTRERIIDAARTMVEEALRVLALAHKLGTGICRCGAG